MMELTKAEKKIAKELLRKGILRRHAEWQSEMRELLDRPFDSEMGNEFSRSMMITAKAREFYKEAKQMEDYYRNTMIPIGLANLFQSGYLTSEDLAALPDDLREWIENHQC